MRASPSMHNHVLRVSACASDQRDSTRASVIKQCARVGVQLHRIILAAVVRQALSLTYALALICQQGRGRMRVVMQEAAVHSTHVHCCCYTLHAHCPLAACEHALDSDDRARPRSPDRHYARCGEQSEGGRKLYARVHTHRHQLSVDRRPARALIRRWR